MAAQFKSKYAKFQDMEWRKIAHRNSYKYRTWLAIMYNSRLYAAPCQAVFEKAPVTLIILLFKENMRYNLRIY